MHPGTRDPATPVRCLQPRSPDIDWLNNLPVHDWLELEALETAPKKARQRLADDLEKWSLPQFEVSAAVVLSEIVTNATIATNALLAAYAAAGGAGAAMPTVTVWLCGGPSVVAFLAWDASVTPPEQRHAGPDDESGRGLAIIEQLSADWGYYYPAGIGGKVTWAVIDRP